MAQDLIELRALDAGASKQPNQQQDVTATNSDPQHPVSEFSLPPGDTGKEAWLFPPACWGVEAVTFGTPASTRGILLLMQYRIRGFVRSLAGLLYYSTHEAFAGSGSGSGSIAIIGTTTMVRLNASQFLAMRVISVSGDLGPRRTIRRHQLPPVPSASALVHACGAVHRCFGFGHELFLHHCASTDCDARRGLRLWRKPSLLPLHAVH